MAVQASFKEGLGGINAWYGHPLTTVLLVDSDLPEGSHTNTQPYKDRGWCRMEMRASGMVKASYCLISLGKLSGEEREWHEVYMKGRGDREPPTAPPAFTAELEGGVASGEVKFTNKGDVSLVTGIYDEAFVSQMERATTLIYSALRWDDAQGAALCEALRYAHAKGGLRKLKMLNLYGNRLGDAFVTSLVALLDEGGLVSLEELALDNNAISERGMQELAAAIARGGLPACTKIDLSRNPVSGAPVQAALAQRQK